MRRNRDSERLIVRCATPLPCRSLMNLPIRSASLSVCGSVVGVSEDGPKVVIASERPHRTVPHCTTADQRDGKLLRDGIQKQPATRKARNSRRIHSRSQRPDSCVNKLSHSAQFHVAPGHIPGCR